MSSSVIAGLVLGIAFFVILTAIVDSSVNPDIPQEQLGERQNTATAIVMSLPEVQATTRNASHVTTEYRWLPHDRDRVTVSVPGFTDYEPLRNSSGIIFTITHSFNDVWLLDLPIEIGFLENTMGFTRAETGNKKITIDIDRKTNSVISTKVDPLPDRTVNAKFTEKQKKAIELVLSDGGVQELAAQHRYFIQQIRPGVWSSACSDPEGCILVGLGLMSKPRLGVHTTVIVDIVAGNVLDVSPPISER